MWSSSSTEPAQKGVTETPDQFEPPLENPYDTNKDASISATDFLKIKINPVPQETSEKETSENPNNFKLLPN
jgi:hypothetical protein